MQKHIGAIPWEGIASPTYRCGFFRSSPKSSLGHNNQGEVKRSLFDTKSSLGANLDLKLTDSTLDDLKAGFRFQNMPQTFQDAIWVTRRLGYSLLWIDSLCIFQYSEEDWVREAVSMADVYRNCVLTIAMLGAKDSNQGCFGQPDLLLYRPCWLSADEEGHDEYVHPHLGDDDMSSSSSNKAPLRERV